MTSWWAEVVDWSPRIAVVGTGANGASIGADLTRVGHDVTFVEQWPAHVEAMRERGITVRTPESVETTGVEVVHLCDVATLRRPFDLVLILVKAYDTRWACELIKPLLARDGVVAGLQNGMTFDDMAEILGPSRTLGSVIEVSSNMFEPGLVERQRTRDKSWFALGSEDADAHDRAPQVAEVLGAAGTVEVSEDIRSSKWMKLVVNAAELVPSAILGLPLSEAEATPGMRDLMLAAGHEAVAAAVASGCSVRPIFGMDDAAVDDPERYVTQVFDQVLTRFTLADTRTTVLQDWMKGRRSEVVETNGRVAHELNAVGRGAPANKAVTRFALEIEQGERNAAPENAQELVDAWHGDLA